MSSINNISLYIPHVFESISKEFVSETFEKLRIGKILTVDFVQKMGKDAAYNAAYLHFEYWYDNTAARNFQERVMNPEKEARIIYDEPWYWIVLENKAKKHVSGERKLVIALGLQEEEADFEPVKQMMSNKDFSELIKKPVKKWPIASGLANPIAPGLQVMDDDAIMEELEALMDEEECEHLITIDGRYVQELENENMFLRESTMNSLYVQGLKEKNQELMDELSSLRALMGQLSQRF